MSKAARVGDSCAGHDCFPATPIMSGSPDVFINGLPAARVGDIVVPHACPCPYFPHSIHPRTISEGSSSVSMNGKPAARTGDAIGCGGSISSGANNVFIGDTPYQPETYECVEGAVDKSAPFLALYPMAKPLPFVYRQQMVDRGDVKAINRQTANSAQSSTAIDEQLTTTEAAPKLLSKEAILQRQQQRETWFAKQVATHTQRGKSLITTQSGKKGGWNPKLNQAKPNTIYLVDDNKCYHTDELGRVCKVEALLDLDTMDRNSYQQLKAGKLGIEGDEGGHLIATILRGSGEKINLQPMNSNLNRSEWKKLENKWAKALAEGKQVKVSIEPKYTNGSLRPDKYVITYQIDNNKPKLSSFFNTHQGSIK